MRSAELLTPRMRCEIGVNFRETHEQADEQLPQQARRGDTLQYMGRLAWIALILIALLCLYTLYRTFEIDKAIKPKVRDAASIEAQ
jgi:hypothetical protein